MPLDKKNVTTSMYSSRVGNIFKVDKKRCPNAKNMRIYYMNL